ncbi:DUF1642 domain-containing protein [Enterococcus sp. C50]|uniref:DUF1642 domain-containing protein n=1 Tax=Enterococcus sp. C50 TaxID=3231311 RepID=UPI00349FF505
MNKQELIEELKNEIALYERERGSDLTIGAVTALNKAISYVKKLAEPQKPVVPISIGKLIDNYKEERVKLSEILSCWETWKDTDEYHIDEVNWIVANPETFMRAWLDGYEVEKEPLYRVKLGEGYFVEYQGRGALIIPDDNKEIKVFDSKSDAERTAQTIGGTVEEVVEG